MINPKVGKVKMDKQIFDHVTAPMSGEFSKSRSWFIPPRVSIPESDGKGSQGHDEWGQARSRQLSWPP